MAVAAAALISQHGVNRLHLMLLALLPIAWAALSFPQLKAMETAYPDASVVAAIAEKLGEGDSVLSENPYLFRYFGRGRLPQSQIKESNWLDNDRDGKHESQDVIDAIWDRKFRYVYLNDQLHPALNVKLRKTLQQRGYKVVITQPYTSSAAMGYVQRGSLVLYRRPE